jgi:hypothetical protein
VMTAIPPADGDCNGSGVPPGAGLASPPPGAR